MRTNKRSRDWVWGKREFDYKDAEQWIEIGLTPKEFKLAYWLREEKSKITEVEDFDNPQWIKEADLDLKQLKNEFFNINAQEWIDSIDPRKRIKFKPKAQMWLDNYYPLEEREKITEIDTKDWNIDLGEEDTEGKFKFENFPNLRSIMGKKS